METMTNQPPSTPMRLTPDQFQPGDVVRYFGERFVVAPPEMRGRNVAVAVEGVDGDPIIERSKNSASCARSIRRRA